jgi:phosphatidylglycerol:prolipoprotein diacylglycerol transferase
MRPILFKIGGVEVQSFFFMIMVAALASTYFARRIARREGLSEIVILDMALIGVIMSIIGARIFHIVVEAPDYYIEKPIRVFYFWQGGFVSLGAFIFTAVAWIIYFRKRKLPLLKYLDVGALSAPVIIFFVRVGCLMAGCCYGKPTNFPIHLVFRNPASTAYLYYPNVPLHATQLYSMMNAALMLVVLYTVYRRRRFDGQISALFLTYYGVTRFFIEFLRGDADRGLYFGGRISTGQIVMGIFFVAGVLIWKLLSRRKVGEEIGDK